MQPWPKGSGERSLTALLWRWQAAAGDETVLGAAVRVVEGSSMTMVRAGLQALQPQPSLARGGRCVPSMTDGVIGW